MTTGSGGIDRTSRSTPRVAFVQALTAVQARAAQEAEVDGRALPFARELAEVRAELETRGVEVVPTYSDRELPSLGGLAPDEVFAFGGLQTMWAWVQRLGLRERVAGSYPSSLASLLHREVSVGTPDQLRAGPARRRSPVFLKPSRPCFFQGERLEGQVCESVTALDALPSSHRGEAFHCAEVVEWVSEYRCYVARSRILGVFPYQALGLTGRLDCAELERCAPDFAPSRALLTDAVRRLDEAGQSVAGYCLDLGLISGRAMSLVELNDGLALANYGLAPADYVDLHVARWSELVRPATGRR